MCMLLNSFVRRMQNLQYCRIVTFLCCSDASPCGCIMHVHINVSQQCCIVVLRSAMNTYTVYCVIRLAKDNQPNVTAWSWKRRCIHKQHVFAAYVQHCMYASHTAPYTLRKYPLHFDKHRMLLHMADQPTTIGRSWQYGRVNVAAFTNNTCSQHMYNTTCMHRTSLYTHYAGFTIISINTACCFIWQTNQAQSAGHDSMTV